MNIILDTNIYYSAFLFDRKVLDTLDECYTKHEVFISDKIFNEIIGKLNSENLKRVHPGFDHRLLSEFLYKIQTDSIFVNPESKHKKCRDPKDDKFLDLADLVKADYIITGDKDLLVLKQFKTTMIIKPSEFSAYIN